MTSILAMTPMLIGMIVAGLEPTAFFVGLTIGAIVGFASTIWAVIDVSKRNSKK